MLYETRPEKDPVPYLRPGREGHALAGFSAGVKEGAQALFLRPVLRGFCHFARGASGRPTGRRAFFRPVLK